jgi:hypothetical protein
VTFQDLGGLGEFVGGIGVIVSLLYLAAQIRQSSRIERLNARLAVSQYMSDALDRFDDPELQRVWTAALDSGEEPTDEDRELLGRFLFRYFSQTGLAYGFAEIDPDIRSRYEPILMRFLRVAAVQGWWSRQRLFISEPFRSEVDSLLHSIVQK